MAVETVSISCQSGVYTALTVSHTTLAFKAGPGGGRIVAASSLPSPTTEDYFPLNTGEAVTIGDLDAKIYYMPNQGTTAVKVLRQ